MFFFFGPLELRDCWHIPIDNQYRISWLADDIGTPNRGSFFKNANQINFRSFIASKHVYKRHLAASKEEETFLGALTLLVSLFETKTFKDDFAISDTTYWRSFSLTTVLLFFFVSSFFTHFSFTFKESPSPSSKVFTIKVESWRWKQQQQKSWRWTWERIQRSVTVDDRVLYSQKKIDNWHWA